MPTELITTTGAGTWTVPANVTSVQVELVGGGGGGGGDTTLTTLRSFGGVAGSNTTFDTLQAGGGRGGGGGVGGGDIGAAGSGGTGTTTNGSNGQSGRNRASNANGGASGAAAVSGLENYGAGGNGIYVGSSDGGGGGGGGGYSNVMSHSVVPGNTINYIVGAGGRAGGSGAGNGASGAIRLTYTSGGTPPPPSPGAEQSFVAPASWFSGSSSHVRWNAPNNSRPRFNNDLTPASNPALYYWFLILWESSGRVQLWVEKSQTSTGDSGADLSSAFETDGSIEITVQGRSLVIAVSGDSAEPYSWTPANTADIQAFIAYVFALPANQRAATFTFRDFIPRPAVVAPSIAVSGVRDITDTQRLALTIDVTGGHYDALEYSTTIVSGGGRLEGANTNRVTYIPADIGSDTPVRLRHVVTARGTGATAAVGTAQATTDSTFTVSDQLLAADAPDVSIIGARTITGDDTLTLDVVVTGGRYDTLTYSLAVSAGGGSVAPNDRARTVYTPPPGLASQANVTVQVTVVAAGTGTGALDATTDQATAQVAFLVLPAGTHLLSKPVILYGEIIDNDVKLGYQIPDADIDLVREVEYQVNGGAWQRGSLTRLSLTPQTTDAQDNQDGYVPPGFTADPQGISEEWPYEYRSFRHGAPGDWEKFSILILDRSYGRAGRIGIDGTPGIRGLSSYDRAIELTLFRTTRTAVNAGGEWHIDEDDFDDEGWPDDLDFYFHIADNDLRNEVNIVAPGALITLYKDDENWADYEVDTVSASDDRYAFTSLNLQESIGALGSPADGDDITLHISFGSGLYRNLFTGTLIVPVNRIGQAGDSNQWLDIDLGLDISSYDHLNISTYVAQHREISVPVIAIPTKSTFPPTLTSEEFTELGVIVNRAGSGFEYVDGYFTRSVDGEHLYAAGLGPIGGTYDSFRVFSIDAVRKTLQPGVQILASPDIGDSFGPKYKATIDPSTGGGDAPGATDAQYVAGYSNYDGTGTNRDEFWTWPFGQITVNDDDDDITVTGIVGIHSPGLGGDNNILLFMPSGTANTDTVFRQIRIKRGTLETVLNRTAGSYTSAWRAPSGGATRARWRWLGANSANYITASTDFTIEFN